VASGGSGVDGITQFSSQSNVNAVTQDGYASAELSGVRIDGNGVLNGVFTNGQTKAVGQVAVARFRSNDGLGRAGQNLWIATRESGDAAMGVAGSGGRGAIVSGALEQSNVDVTAQFVELISRQRSFQANSKTITTADQMLETIQQLVR
jgi:flagellar hook protein FlgE